MKIRSFVTKEILLGRTCLLRLFNRLPDVVFAVARPSFFASDYKRGKKL